MRNKPHSLNAYNENVSILFEIIFVSIFHFFLDLKDKNKIQFGIRSWHIFRFGLKTYIPETCAIVHSS